MGGELLEAVVSKDHLREARYLKGRRVHGLTRLGAFWEEPFEWDPFAGLCHHGSDDLTPREVMGRLFVGGRVPAGGVGFIEDEVGFVVGVLENIKAPVVRLLSGRFVVGLGGVNKLRDTLLFNVDMNDGDFDGGSPG